MEIQSQLHLKLDDIQRKLRECNFECNRLKELIDKSLLEAQQSAIQHLKQSGILSSNTSNPTIATPHEAVLPSTSETPALEPLLQTVSSAETLPVAPALGQQPAVMPQVPVTPKVPKLQSKRNMEEFIGGNLLNKIGIAILIIGIGIFVKYAIDKDWIGPVGRVMVGLLSGGILLGVAHYLRKSYKAFSSVLLGGGIAVLYFSVAIAFHQYALLSQPAAFGLMCLVTASAVFFSLAYNRQEIAIIAVLGGFGTPFMLMNGEGNYVALFGYLMVLNVGMLVLSAMRNWQAVRVTSFALTLLVYLGWLINNLVWVAEPALGGTLAFGIAFFVVFFAMNLVFFVRAQKALGTLEYVLLLSNSAFFYFSGMAILNTLGSGTYMGLYTALMGAFHFGFVFPVRKLIRVDSHVQTMLIGIVLTFLTLAVPIQLEGRYMTMFWALEAALVLYLGQRTRVRLLRAGAVILSGLSLVALLVDWSRFYFIEALAPDRVLFLNGAFVTGLVACVGILVQHFLYLQRAKFDVLADRAVHTTRLLIMPVAYLTVALELGVHFGRVSEASAWIAVLTFSFLFLSGMQVWATRSKSSILAMISSALTLGAIGAFGVFHFMALDTARATNSTELGWHFWMVPGMFLAFALSFKSLKDEFGWTGSQGRFWVWGSAAVGIFLASTTLDNLMALGGVSLQQVHRTGYPILWGLIGAGMIVAGLRMKVVALRSGGLILFLLILLKLFAFDIREASTGGKIAAFICLGVLLLLVSFLYQKLKLLLSDETEQPIREPQNPS